MDGWMDGWMHGNRWPPHGSKFMVLLARLILSHHTTPHHTRPAAGPARTHHSATASSSAGKKISHLATWPSMK